MKLSIVLPAFSEEDNISYIYQKIIDLNLGDVQITEFIFVDDGSSDGTLQERC